MVHGEDEEGKGRTRRLGADSTKRSGGREERFRGKLYNKRKERLKKMVAL